MRILEPRRSKYKIKYSGKDKCQFCIAHVLKDQGVKALETKHWQVLACKYPYLNGNLMIIPKRHVEKIEEINSDEWAEFPNVLKATQKLLSKLFKTESFNLAMNIGPLSGGTIKHLHLMIVPRSKLENLSGFNMFHDFYLVSMSYKDLLKKIKSLK